MFDGLDIGPLFCAPFVALFAATTVNIRGHFSLKRIRHLSISNSVFLKRFLILISIGLLPFACIFSIGLRIGSAVPSPWVKPSIFDISGKWVFSKCTLERFDQKWRTVSENPGYIKFNLDGRIDIKDIPAFWKADSESQLVSANGSWHIEETWGRIGVKEWLLFADLYEINNEQVQHSIGFYFDGH